MSALICMLRGVNLGNRRIKMDALKAMCKSLGLRDPETYVQTGNIVFDTEERELGALVRRIENAIEKTFGFRSDAIVRTASEMRDVIAKNPFAGRAEVEPGKLLVTFLANYPAEDGVAKVRAMKTEPDELQIHGRELYTYFPNGMARPKVSWVVLERALKTSGTGRNWNTVTKLLEMAEKLS